MSADDDDDVFFGHFKLASKPQTTSSPVPPSIPTDSFDDNDDDWGEFVATRSDQINGEESPAVTWTESAPSWAKPSGALPLSLFGEAEEEKSGEGESSFGYGEPILFGGEKKKGSSLNGSVGIGDLIADLYGPSEKIKVQNQGESDWNSNSNSSTWDQNGFDSKIHGANSSSSKLDFNGLSADLVQQSENFDDDDNEDYGWEFQGADADNKEQRAVEGPGLKVEIVTAKDGEIQVEGGGRVKIEEPKLATELTNGSHGHVDTLIQSNNTSEGAGDWNLAFDFNPVSVNQDDHLWDSYSESKKNTDAQLVPNLSFFGDNRTPSDNFWQFEDSFSGARAEPQLEATKVSAPADLGVKTVNGDGAHEPTDPFASSVGSFHRPKEWGFEFTFNPSSAIEDSTIRDVTFESKTNEIGKGTSSSWDDKHDDSEDNVWAFRDAFSESGLKDEGKSMVTHDPLSYSIPLALDGANQGNEINSASQREALPLSLFGEEELETDAFHVDQDVSTQTFSTYTRNSNNNSVPSLSINDLVSSLYGQAEVNTIAHDEPKASENEPSSIARAMESGLVYPDDDFDDNSWEFKDASWDGKAQNQTFATSLEDSLTKSSMKLQLDDFIDFYCKLKDESCHIALSHYETLKKAQSSGLEGLGEETQKFYDQLCRDNMISEFHLENLSQRSSGISELLEVLHEPKFRVLESKYHLSNQLSLAEKDWGSAIELSRHVTSTLRILKLGSAEEQSSYVATWSKIVTVCAQQLKHGASIWKQALQKNVAGQILSELQGRQYIAALGEIYRVVQVIGATVKLYKPWILLDSEGPVCVYALLNECTALWSTSGLDEALESISESIDSKSDRALIELLDSIKYIHSLDSLALHDHVFSGEQPFCRLSMLTPEVLPGMKAVVWDGNQYLLKLANLWANLISSDPPDLPCLTIY